MEHTGTLFDLIQRLDDFQDHDRLHPLVLYARNGAITDFELQRQAKTAAPAPAVRH